MVALIRRVHPTDSQRDSGNQFLGLSFRQLEIDPFPVELLGYCTEVARIGFSLLEHTGKITAIFLANGRNVLLEIRLDLRHLRALSRLLGFNLAETGVEGGSAGIHLGSHL